MSEDKKIDENAETWPTQYWHGLEDDRVNATSARVNAN